MSFLEDDPLNEKYIEYAMKSLEDRENQYIIDTKFDNQLTGKEIEEKSNEISSLISQINKKHKNKYKKEEYLSEDEYNIFHALAVSKGGFLNMKYRREIYKILLHFNEDENITSKNDLKYYKTIWINKKNNKLYWKNEPVYQDLIPVKERTVIKADAPRSDINSTFQSKQFPYINSFLKIRLEEALNILINFNNNEFNYFQGYHDMFVLFFYLYMDSPYTYISLYQRFSELYIKENLLKQKKSNEGYSFPNSIKFCMRVIKELNINVYDNLVKYCNSECIFVVPFIISLFTHNLSDLNKRYRIIDYFLVSNPISVYVMSCVLVVEEINKMLTEYNVKKLKATALSFFGGDSEPIPELSLTDFYSKIQTLDLEKINYEELIEKTEKALNNINLEEIRKEFMSEKYKYKKFYPIMYEKKYLRDLTQINDNKKIEEKSDEKNDDNGILFTTMVSVYELLYGKKKYSRSDVKYKKEGFYGTFIAGIVLITSYLIYLMFTKKK